MLVAISTSLSTLVIRNEAGTARARPALACQEPPEKLISNQFGKLLPSRISTFGDHRRRSSIRAMRYQMPFSMRDSIRLLSLSCALTLSAGCEGESADSNDTNPARSLDSVPHETVEVSRAKTPSELLGGHTAHRYPASLETVLEKRFLRVLTSQNAFDFFLRQGEPGGYQYEMAKAFTRFLNKKHAPQRGDLPIQFELIPVDGDQFISLLLDGAGDMIAARLTVTPERASRVQFSEPYRSVDELLVTHDQTPPIDSLEQLSGKVVAVRKSSSYYASLLRLNQDFERDGRKPIQFEFVDESLVTERILELVAARRFAYTVCDSIVAEFAVKIHPQLRIVEGVALRRGGDLGWATIPSAAGLAQEMNAFLSRYEHGSLLGNIAISKYFAAENQLADRMANHQATTISDYDGLFKKFGAQFGVDWRLVAALAFQESRFDAAAHNRWGAVGLLQIKPRTAREPYIDIPEIEGPEQASNNVKAGLKYLSWIKKRYFDTEADMRERDRVRMSLAAYNAGPRTIINARRRASQLGLDPTRWFRNVELALLDMRKTEPVKYVSEINQRYLAYVLLGIE
jgi:membrane-bound lytic murein transglycosylase MltF